MKIKNFNLFTESIAQKFGKYNLPFDENINTQYKDMFYELYIKNQSIIDENNELEVKALIDTFNYIVGKIRPNKNTDSYKDFYDFIERHLFNNMENWNYNSNMIDLIASSIIFIYQNKHLLKTGPRSNILDFFGDEKQGRVGYIGLGCKKFLLYGIYSNLESLVIENKNIVYFIVFGYDTTILRWDKRTDELRNTGHIRDDIDQYMENNTKLDGEINKLTQEEITKAISDIETLFNKGYTYELSKIDFYDKLDINFNNIEDDKN